MNGLILTLVADETESIDLVVIIINFLRKLW